MRYKMIIESNNHGITLFFSGTIFIVFDTLCNIMNQTVMEYKEKDFKYNYAFLLSHSIDVSVCI